MNQNLANAVKKGVGAERREHRTFNTGALNRTGANGRTNAERAEVPLDPALAIANRFMNLAKA
jgi:hypothetical protein